MSDEPSGAGAARLVRPLPSNPNLEMQRKLAKALARDYWRGGAEAIARVRAAHPKAPALDDFVLSDAQLVIAREYGFAGWPQLKKDRVADQIAGRSLQGGDRSGRCRRGEGAAAVSPGSRRDDQCADLRLQEPGRACRADQSRAARSPARQWRRPQCTHRLGQGRLRRARAGGSGGGRASDCPRRADRRLGGGQSRHDGRARGVDRRRSGPRPCQRRRRQAAAAFRAHGRDRAIFARSRFRDRRA